MSRNRNDVRSLYVSLPGVLGLLVLTVISAYFRLEVLPYILFVSFVVSLVSYLWGRFSLSRIRVESEGAATRVFPGQEISFSLEAMNDKFLPLLWLEADYFDQKPDFLGSEGGFRRRFTWVGPMQSLQWDVNLKGLSRGVCFLDGISFLSGDGFGLSVERRRFELDQKHLLVVYPKVFPINAEDLVRDTLELNPGKKGYLEDYTLFRGNRDYSQGDSSRFINWRVLAKGGPLTVNQFEPVVPECVTFLLDLKSFSEWEECATSGSPMLRMTRFYAQELEDMISLVASAILALTERKVRCALMVPGIVYKSEEGEETRVPGRSIRPEDLDSQVMDLLTELSGLKYFGEDSFLPKAEMAQQLHGIGQLYMVVKSPESTSMRHLLGLLDSVDMTYLSYDDSMDVTYKVRTLGELRKRNA